ncbi:hypothetical protein DFH07DRAFT_781832 [Mycena maculata]|uniref:Uncharacterized protein n=1 Tax=Mycena maculata TaxID=230809 RepID=A0AAD7HWD3_9AGAR|nr:hypothetical protein DFH07DRAFT_781832 [Mycena maculata]
MPSSSFPSSSPTSSPTRATDNLLELAQLMSPSKPPDVLRRETPLHPRSRSVATRNIEARANEIQDNLSTLKRCITDYENEATTTARPKKQRKRNNRAADADDSIPNPQTIEDRTREKGSHFVVEEALFLVDSDVFTVEEDEDFEPCEEFASDQNRIQGQLLQIKRYLPDDVKHLRTTTLISGAFIDGMSGQRSSTSNRLRVASLSKIVDDIKRFETSSGRFNAFAKLIGYQPGTPTREPYYSKLDAPILYNKWEGKKDLGSFLRGPILLKIHATIIRGPNGATGLFSGKSKRPSAKTVEKMYKIHRTSLGAISNAACLAIWMHSADTQLVEIGDETGINYRERQSYCLQCILDGLANDKAWAVDLIAYWDHILFPDADAPRDGHGSMGDQRLEAQEDEEEFFGSAPSVEHPKTPTRPDILQSPSSNPSPRSSPVVPAPSPPRRSAPPPPPPRPFAPAHASHVQLSGGASASPPELVRGGAATSGDRAPNRSAAAASLLKQRR